MQDTVVKSVGRVFSILELFDRERRSLTASEISRHLALPHSSTVAILKSMQTLDYLSMDRNKKSYYPSSKLPQVAEWIFANVHDETAILAVMSDLHESIDETINMSRQTGDFVKIVYGLESRKLLGIRTRPGVVMPLTASHTGMVALATYTDEEVGRIIQDRQNRRFPEARSLSVRQALNRVRKIRAQKYSPGYDALIEGIGIIAFPLRSETGAQPFVIAIAGPTERIRANESEIIRVARESVKRHHVSLAYPD